MNNSRQSLSSPGLTQIRRCVDVAENSWIVDRYLPDGAGVPRQQFTCALIAVELAQLPEKGPTERYRVAEARRTLLWGVLLPLLAILGALIVSPWALALLLAWPLQMLRLWVGGQPPEQAVFLTLGKLPEAQGLIGYWLGRFTGRRRGLIEYK